MDKHDVVFEMIEDGDIEQCRDLCDELMAYQYAQSVKYRDFFKSMNFDTRLKLSYAKAADKAVMIAKDKISPIGYVYLTIEDLGQESITPLLEAIPNWAQNLYADGETIQSFYPRWLKPQAVGHIENLYIKPEYRQHGIGKQFMATALDIFKNRGNLNYAFVHVSNGNTQAADFYEKFGFQYSHDVFKGFITAYIKEL